MSLLKKAHLPLACHWQACKMVALDRAEAKSAPNGLAPTYYSSTPPLADSSRALHLGPF
jgi:hypothetical protein